MLDTHTALLTRERKNYESQKLIVRHIISISTIVLIVLFYAFGFFSSPLFPFLSFPFLFTNLCHFCFLFLCDGRRSVLAGTAVDVAATIHILELLFHVFFSFLLCLGL